MPWGSAPYISVPTTKLALLVEINVVHPSATLIFTNQAIFDNANYGTGLASVGQASAIRMAEFAIGAGNAEHVLGIRNVRPISGANGNSDFGHDDFASFLTEYVLEGATVSIYQYIEGGGTSARRCLLANGSVLSVTDITSRDVTIHIVDNLAWENNECPKGTVTKINIDAPEISKGLDLPLRLGPNFFYSPKLDPAFDIYDAISVIGPGMMKSSLIPARYIDRVTENNTTGYSVAFADWHGPNYSIYNQVGGITPKLYIQDQNIGGFRYQQDWAPTKRPSDTYAATLGYYGGTIQEGGSYGKQYIWIMIDEVVSKSGAVVVINAENLADAKPDTYASLSGIGNVQFRIPQVSELGTIQNTTYGLQIVVFVVPNPPNATPGSGQFKVKFLKPTDYTQSDKFGNSSVLYATDTCGWHGVENAAGTDQYLAHSIWEGTRMQRFQLLCASESDINHIEAKLYEGDDNANQPYYLNIETISQGVHVNIAGIAILALFDPSASDVGSWKRGLTADGKRLHVDWINDNSRQKAIERYKSNAPILSFDPIARNMPFDAELMRKAYSDLNNDPVSPEGLWVWFPGIYDSGNNHGTGTDWIQTPGCQADFITARYAGNEFTKSPSYNFGSVQYFDKIMEEWAKRHSIGGNKFLYYWWTHQRRSVDTVIADLMSELPGRAGTSLNINGQNSLIAMDPVSDSWQYLNGRHDCVEAGGLTPFHIPRDPSTGLPGIEATRSTVREIYNRYEIQYQFDPVTGSFGKTATCDATSSDDGYGNAWPVDPSQSYTASELCNMSKAYFTGDRERKFTVALRYHWEPNTVMAFATWILWRHWRPFVTLRMLGTLACESVLPGQIVEISNEIKTSLGLSCPVPFRGTSDWTGFLWHVLSKERRMDRGVSYEFQLEEHIGNGVVPGALHGGPVLTEPTLEGFDT